MGVGDVPAGDEQLPVEVIACPEQNRFEPTGRAVNVFVAGSQMYGSPNLPTRAPSH